MNLKNITFNIYWKIKLFLKGKKKAIAFDVSSVGELQFCDTVISKLINDFPENLYFLVLHGDSYEELKSEYPNIANECVVISNIQLRSRWFQKIDVFITTEQFSHGVDGVYSICLFHGPSSKGVSFNPDIIASFDAFFHLSPIHWQTLDEYLNHKDLKIPKHLKRFKAGYPKSDKLANNEYSEKRIKTQLKINNNSKIVVYAPAFNEYASLREYGEEIINELCHIKDVTVIAKLPIDCWKPSTNIYATGGKNWFSIFSKLENKHKNFILYREYNIDPILSIADVLITCVSSVGMEIRIKNKPVIYMEMSQFYEHVLETFPHADIHDWENRSTINGGREFGVVVSDVKILIKTVQKALKDPKKFLINQDKIKKIIPYKYGKGTENTVKIISSLWKNPITNRKRINKGNIKRTMYKILMKIKIVVNKYLLRHGMTISGVGEGYLDVDRTIKLAKSFEISVCEYLEKTKNGKNRIGRRDRIVQNIIKTIGKKNTKNILEIGTGTGMYLEKIIEHYKPNNYYSYETNIGWKKYLINHYGKKYKSLHLFQADGKTLSSTKNNSCDLIHAHAVFVYTPVFITMSYIIEVARVCKSGGYFIFDYLSDDTLKPATAAKWINNKHFFSVVIPKISLQTALENEGFKIINSFKEIYGASYCTYIVAKKI